MPNVPYFDNGWPGMSATEIYSYPMMPTGIPIDYLKKNPDHYIPQIFGVAGDDSLYAEASKYFGKSSTLASKILDIVKAVCPGCRV